MLVPDAESCFFWDEARLSRIIRIVVAGSDIIIHNFVDAEHGVCVKAWIPVGLEGFSDVDRVLRGDYNVWFKLIVYHFPEFVR